VLTEYLQAPSPPPSNKNLWRLLTPAEKCHAAYAVRTMREAYLRQGLEGGKGALKVIIPELLGSDKNIGCSNSIKTWPGNI